MEKTIEEKNKAIVREAFEAAFNRRDLNALERYWSPDYIQHSAHIPSGRDGLRRLIEALPPEVRYESGIMLAAGDYVTVHGRFTGLGGPNWIVVDIIRFENGILVEHWDVIQDEATIETSKSGKPMFGDKFGTI